MNYAQLFNFSVDPSYSSNQLTQSLPPHQFKTSMKGQLKLRLCLLSYLCILLINPRGHLLYSMVVFIVGTVPAASASIAFLVFLLSRKPAERTILNRQLVMVFFLKTCQLPILLRASVFLVPSPQSAGVTSGRLGGLGIGAYGYSVQFQLCENSFNSQHSYVHFGLRITHAFVCIPCKVQ